MGTSSSSSPKETPPVPVLRPRAPRAPLVHAAHCRYEGEVDFIEVTTLNISQSGMLVRSGLAPTVGAKTEFKFLLETGFEILSGSGTVMRLARDDTGATTVGIAFDVLDPPKQRILARVIELHTEPVDDSD